MAGPLARPTDMGPDRDAEHPATNRVAPATSRPATLSQSGPPGLRRSPGATAARRSQRRLTEPVCRRRLRPQPLRVARSRPGSLARERASTRPADAGVDQRVPPAARSIPLPPDKPCLHTAMRKSAGAPVGRDPRAGSPRSRPRRSRRRRRGRGRSAGVASSRSSSRPRTNRPAHRGGAASRAPRPRDPRR